MPEKPILFSAPMVRAILEDRKAQTRRIIKPQPKIAPENEGIVSEAWDAGFIDIRCPFGKPGDKLWVRETFYCDEFDYPNGPVAALKAALDYRATHDCSNWEAGCPCLDDEGRSAWRPSIHMPRWASRITLEITGIRVERLQEITEADAIAEGVECLELTEADIANIQISDEAPDMKELARLLGPGKMPAKSQYEMLWCSINGKGSWDANPWVWVVEFKGV